MYGCHTLIPYESQYILQTIAAVANGIFIPRVNPRTNPHRLEFSLPVPTPKGSGVQTQESGDFLNF